jgi:dihydrodipicolinate synthase/N-acetylneuraminate lyase
VFVGEHRWTSLGPAGARGGCSSLVYWNPRVILELWARVARGDFASAPHLHDRVCALHEFLELSFGARGLTDTAYDRMGGAACGFLRMSLRSRGPYPSATPDDAAKLREWFSAHFAEMLEHEGDA